MAGTLRIATFNLESLGARDGADPADRVAMLRPQLLRLAADVLCLQEVNGDHGKHRPRGLGALDALLAGTPYAGFRRAHTVARPPDSAYDVHNLVVLSRLPILQHRQVLNELVEPPTYRLTTAVPPPPEAGRLGWDRPLLHVTLELPGGRPLHLLNLHLKAPLAANVPGGKRGPFAWNSVAQWAEGFFVATVKRAGQALEARLLVDRLLDADPEALLLVVGDFNADLQEMPLRLLLGQEEDTGSGSLGPRALVALDRALPADRRHSVLHHGRAQMLDHLLASRALYGLSRDVEVHNEALGDEVVGYSRIDRSAASYHAPVLATFALPQPPGV